MLSRITLSALSLFSSMSSVWRGSASPAESGHVYAGISLKDASSPASDLRAPIAENFFMKKTRKSVSLDLPTQVQWPANFGYCGEISFIVAGLYYGQYLSQYDARALVSRDGS